MRIRMFEYLFMQQLMERIGNTGHTVAVLYNKKNERRWSVHIDTRVLPATNYPLDALRIALEKIIKKELT